jgi:alanine transaminase
MDKNLLTNAAKYGIPADIVERAKTLHEGMGPIGQYSPDHGFPCIQRTVAEYLSRRDGYSVSPEKVIVTDGRIAQLTTVMEVISEIDDVFFVPKPADPLYKAAIELQEANAFSYNFALHGSSWKFDPGHLRKSIRKAE